MSTRQTIIESKIDALNRAKDAIDDLIAVYESMVVKEKIDTQSEVDADIYGGDGIDD